MAAVPQLAGIYIVPFSGGFDVLSQKNEVVCAFVIWVATIASPNFLQFFLAVRGRLALHTRRFRFVLAFLPYLYPCAMITTLAVIIKTT